MASKTIIHPLEASSMPLMVVQQRVNELFDNFLDDWDILPFASEFSSFPSFDVFDTEKEIVIKAEFSDIDEQGITVEISGNQLTIRGNEQAEIEEQEGSYYFNEISFGSFSKTVKVPFEIEEDKIKATFAEGVLTVTIQKPAEKIHQIKMISILH